MKASRCIRQKLRGYLRGYLKIGGQVAFCAYASNLPKERLTWELYKERMKMEGMLEDEKGLFMSEPCYMPGPKRWIGGYQRLVV